MKWYVIEVEDSSFGRKPLKGVNRRLLLNERWEIREEPRSTEEVIASLRAKYPDAECSYTSRFFGGFSDKWLDELDDRVAKYLQITEHRGLAVEVVLRINIIR